MLYSEFKPTQFDSHIAIEDREDWIVVPVTQHRDSGCFDKSNFATAQKILADGDTEIHRFGHWGHGWYEILIAAPTLAEKVDEIEYALANNSVLDENDLSERESEAMQNDWNNYGCHDFERALVAAIESLAEPTESDIEKELRIERERDDFCPEGPTWRTLGIEPPTFDQRIADRLATIEDWNATQWRELFDAVEGSEEYTAEGTTFGIDKAVTAVVDGGLFWTHE